MKTGDGVKQLITAISWGSYYFEDITRIRKDLVNVPDRYHTPTHHQSYPRVRSPAPAVNIGLVLKSGRVAWGDCVPVSFSGKSGRALPKDPQALATWFHENLEPWFKGRSLASWLTLENNFLDEFGDIPAFIRYGVSQAMVSAVAEANAVPLWKIFASELGHAAPAERIALHGSCGGDWGDTVDRMLARGLMFLPQGQFEYLEQQIGLDGKNLIEWIESFKKRAQRFNYQPVLTMDFHGALDELANGNLTKVADMIESFARAALPHHCHIESPILAQDFATFKSRISELKSLIEQRGLTSPMFRIVADEWANSVEDIRTLAISNAVDGVHVKMPDTGTLSECAEAVAILKDCKAFALLGGSCTETMNGAKATAHLASVIRPDAVLVKPGMGFDESFAFLDSEIARAVAEAQQL